MLKKKNLTNEQTEVGFILIQLPAIGERVQIKSEYPTQLRQKAEGFLCAQVSWWRT